MHVTAIFGPAANEKELGAFREDERLSWQPDISPNTDANAAVIFGGDGTVHRHLQRLVELNLPLLVVPCGSGNDFAGALGIYSRKDALTAWKKFTAGDENVRTVDLGIVTPSATAESHYFCTIAGIGLDGEVLRRVNRLPRWFRGNGGYALTLPPALFNFSAMSVKLSSPGSTNDENGFHPILLASFANTPAYGGGMKVAPKAKLDDGKLDICVIREMNKLKLLSVFPSVYFGRHLGISGVEYSQAKSVRLETREPFDVYADGEHVCQTPVEISVKQAALRVIVP